MDQTPPDKPAETLEMLDKRVGYAQREHDRSDRTAASMFPVVASFAVEAQKAAALVNGGSAAAMLAFIGTGRQPVTVDTIFGLKLFGAGLLVAMVATAFAYLTQYFYLREMQSLSYAFELPFVRNTPASLRAKRTAGTFHVVGIAAVLLAYGLAVAGLWYVAGSLVPLPAKT
ncbi:hypothetical protein MKK84_21430 [Methylobacterium sp. E-065]|uniref:hypothetical protein n=1 Tax=Methylobacterium sp. E-065 TaxID=2836583 RepID=UPI001FB8F0C5|nr:hypothetical protein [Methylobacterium sp. E-065]MCJ2019963.1 hypothetical protein [Methylobacterium sp. E-065]